MIKRLDPNQQADSAPAPKAVDGVSTAASHDDVLYVPAAQPTAQPTTQPLPQADPAAAALQTQTAPSAPLPTAVPTTEPQARAPAAVTTSVITEPDGATIVTTTPGSSYTSQSVPPMSSTGADLSAISDINSDIVSRKMALEEAKFQLDSERAKHSMYMEIRKEDFREQQLREEEERNSQKEGEHWMKSYWRPAMGWLYMLICAFDFVIAPMLTMAMPVFLKNLGATTITYTQWQSLTLANGGLIHLAFGAILGITAWTRGQEKIAKMG